MKSNETGNTTLTRWLQAVLWGAILVPACLFLLVSWWGFERAREEAAASVVHAVELARNHALRALVVAEQLAHRADAAAAPRDGDFDERAVNQRLADMASGVPSIVNLNVWDGDGAALARSDVFPVDPRSSVFDRAYFQEMRSGKVRTGVSEVLVGRQTGKELLNLSVPRSAARGEFDGIIAVSLSPGYFRDYYQALAAEEPHLGAYTLLRQDGSLLARWPEATAPQARATSDPALEHLRMAIAAGEAGGSATVAAAGPAPERLVSFRRVGEFPVYVIAEFSRDAMLAGWARFVSTLAAILLPVTLLLTYVAWVALKKTRQLEEQAMRRADAERGMLESQKLETLAILTSGVAHDFNNLLAVVSASLQVLKRQHAELKDSKHVLAMNKAVQSGTRLTRQLLSYSKKQALRPENLSLQSWLPGAESLIKSTLGAHIGWQLTVEPDTRAIHIDVGELELALINLVVNAKHAMPNGGGVRVHAGNAPAGSGGDAAGRAMVHIAVSDTGVGIPQALLNKVLEPFFTTRAKGAGSGLGLSQVDGLCNQAGGRVEITSILEQGTTVTMLLPAVAAAVVVESPAEPVEDDQEIRAAVLLVEDNEDVGATTELMLRTAGMTVVRTPNADAALAYLSTAAERPDVVLSDIAMPGAMNGIGLAFELRRRMPHLPVILTTGYADQLHLASEGGLRVLQKPTPPHELLAELRAVVAGRRQS